MTTPTPSGTTPSDPLYIDRIVGAPTLFSVIRERRGWTPDFITQLESSSNQSLQNIDAMVAALHQVRTRGEKIVIIPDYDVDGITSGIVGLAGLAELGFDVELSVPDFRRGHDVLVSAVQEAHERFPTATTMITCDAGINSNDAIEYGKSLGLTMLVTDHHVELDPGSSADIAVDPDRMAESYSGPAICGAVVFYTVIRRYAQTHAPSKIEDIELLKLFAGLGTVADVMPLHQENRQMVRNSLSIARLLYVDIPAQDLTRTYDIDESLLMQILKSTPHAPQYIDAFIGFALLLESFRTPQDPRPVIDPTGNYTLTPGATRPVEISSLTEDDEVVTVKRSAVLSGPKSIDEQFYAFYIAPALNAIRRIDGEMIDGFGMFLPGSIQAKREHIERVRRGNEWRRELTTIYVTELEQRPQPMAPFIYITDAPLGMLGLLASKLADESGQPTAVITLPDDPSAPRGGSARSPFWFPIITTMAEGGFVAVGHENACGVRMHNEKDMVAFYEHMTRRAGELQALALLNGDLAEKDKSELILGEADGTDAPGDDLEELLELIGDIENMRPYGHGFERPTVELVVNLSRVTISTLGSEKTHLKMVLPSGLKVLWWNAADLLPALRERAAHPVPEKAQIRLKVDLSINEFMGYTSAQAQVKSVIGENPRLEESIEVDENGLEIWS